jgi:hypothetical protein
VINTWADLMIQRRMKATSRTAAGFEARRVFGAPALLGLVSAIGLLSALLGDDIRDAVSWLTLGAPLLVIAWHLTRPARS